jgi:hypothetical protein
MVSGVLGNVASVAARICDHHQQKHEQDCAIGNAHAPFPFADDETILGRQSVRV